MKKCILPCPQAVWPCLTNSGGGQWGRHRDKDKEEIIDAHVKPSVFKSAILVPL